MRVVGSVGGLVMVVSEIVEVVMVMMKLVFWTTLL